MKRLRPLLFKYRVSAYFCGHDHSMQHLREANTTLDYFVVGAGHLTDPSQIHKVKWLERTSSHLPHLSVTWPLPLPMQTDVPKDSLHFWYAPLDLLDEHGAFATVSVDQHSLNTTYYTSKGGRGRAGHEFLLCIFYLCLHRHGNSNPHRQIAIHVSEHPSTTEHSWTQVMLAKGAHAC